MTDLHIPISLSKNKHNPLCPYSMETFYQKCIEYQVPIIQWHYQYQQCPEHLEAADFRFKISIAYRGAWLGNINAIMECIRHGIYIKIKMPVNGLPTICTDYGIHPSIVTFVDDCGKIFNAVAFKHIVDTADIRTAFGQVCGDGDGGGYSDGDGDGDGDGD